jgi:uncharacterized protein (TIGR01777 family)
MLTYTWGGTAMRAFITGGTGFIGMRLSSFLTARGYDVTLLARKPGAHADSARKVKMIAADSSKPGDWQREVAGHDVLINLAGASIFHRWNEDYKQLLLDSRIKTTRNLVDAIPSDSTGRVVLFNASGAGYYGMTGDEQLDESSPRGSDFLANLAQDWESEALKAEDKQVRVIRARFGIVLGRDGGALTQMVLPFRFFAGGPIGSGRQWISWIHIEDLCRALLFVVENEHLRGAFNFTAPFPATNGDFAKTIGEVLHRPSFMPAPGFMMRLVLGEFAEYILNGQRVIPKKLLDSGFHFDYPTIEEALRSLL